MTSTFELDRLFREAEMLGIRTAIEAAGRLRPHLGAEGVPAAGGLAAFTGSDSPLSQVYGAGMAGPVAREEIARIDAFYEARGATPKIFVTPLCDPSLATHLAAFGFAPREYVNLFACELDGTGGARDPRIRESGDPDAWGAASARGFLGVETPDDGDAHVGVVIARSEGVTALEAREGDAAVATAAMDVRGRVSSLFAASTLPAFRGRGWHAAMIRDRLARAKEAGARFARGSAHPGSASERNFLRCGFRVLYTTAVWERAPRSVPEGARSGATLPDARSAEQ
jgi:hypothetical protein